MRLIDVMLVSTILLAGVARRGAVFFQALPRCRLRRCSSSATSPTALPALPSAWTSRSQRHDLRAWSSLSGSERSPVQHVGGLDDDLDDGHGLEDGEADLDDEEDEEEGEDDEEGIAGEGSLRLKVRQHVNPLASRYRVPVTLPQDWLDQTFPNPTQPLLLDIGCAKGTWSLKYAKANPHHNIIGLEIRRPVVELALKRKQVWGLSNAHFIATNANVDIGRILGDVRARGISVVQVSIHHPDPHFKNKHKKRRVLTDEFAAQLVSLLASGTRLFVQSDVLDCCQDMVATLAACPGLKVEDGHSCDALDRNPPSTGIKTEREVATLAKGLPVYRCSFLRT